MLPTTIQFSNIVWIEVNCRTSKKFSNDSPSDENSDVYSIVQQESKMLLTSCGPENRAAELSFILSREAA